jgi:membrane protein required for beta-lactamase induction
MTILIVLLGLLLSHLIYPWLHPRNFGWFNRVLGAVKQRASGREWFPAVAVFGIAIAVAVLASAVVEHSLGFVGWFLLALAVFVYTLGPRDLDRDVEALLNGGNGREHLEALRVMRIERNADATAASAGIFHAAQTRWFGILFWFVVLGIAGALLYRLTRLSLHFPDWTEGEAAWLIKLRFVLDWPVLVLMLISAGLVGDLDAVRRTWRVHVSTRSRWFIRDDVLDGVAALSVAPEATFDEGVQAGHLMVRRMLLIWLVVLSLLLIAGWLS